MRIRLAAVTVAVLLSPTSFLEAQDATATPPAPQTGGQRYLGPDGSLLPFESDEEALEFLSTGEIISRERIPVGVTRPQEVLLEKDGVRAKATYKDIDVTYERTRMSNGEYAMNLRDYYMFERAAYEMSRLLGLDNVPPTVIRQFGRDRVSLQLWIENAMTEEARTQEGLRAPNRMEWTRQVQTMYLFDDLIGNVDRNQGDCLIDRETWKLWMIDHSRAFQRDNRLRYVEKIMYCDRAVWERLRALDQEEVRQKLGEYLTRYEVEAMFERRDAVVKYIQQLIDERGEGAVLFSTS